MANEELAMGDVVDEVTGELVSINKIGENEIQKATETLLKYKAMKENLDHRIINALEWYKKRYNERLDNGSEDKYRAKLTTGWLHSCIDNKVADFMDNYPEVNVLAKEPDDEITAEQLSSILPVVYKNANYRNTYYRKSLYKVLNGTSVVGVFWNQKLLNGFGDIDIRRCEMLNLFWDMRKDNIQDSQHFFSVDLVSNRQLELEYPEQIPQGALGGHKFSKNEYYNDESINTDDMSYVIDWYYKANVDGKDVVHLCKYVDNIVLYATENDPELTDRGLYDDGKYPFVFDVLFDVPNSAAGYGYVDLLKDDQVAIDKMSQAFLENTISQATPRWAVREDADVNEEDLADLSKHVVRVGASVGEDAIRPIQTNQIGGSSFNMLSQMIETMKETSGNRDVSTGGTTSGVTAASAIAAMQEAGSKTSRMHISNSYNAENEIAEMVIERIRQFYDLPRTFRIIGNDAVVKYMEFTNEQMQLRSAGLDFTTGTEYMRLPSFDVEISASKASPYSKMAQNEQALQMYAQGFFNPQNSDQALAVLEQMDFDHKDKVVKKIEENGTMYDMIQQLMGALQVSNQIIGELTGQDLMSGMPNPAMMGGASEQGQAPAPAPKSNSLGEDMGGNDLVSKSKKRVADSTTPS